VLPTFGDDLLETIESAPNLNKLVWIPEFASFSASLVLSIGLKENDAVVTVGLIVGSEAAKEIGGIDALPIMLAKLLEESLNFLSFSASSFSLSAIESNPLNF